MIRIGLPVPPGEKLRAVLKAVVEGITVLDRDHKVLWANQVVESWAGRLKDLKGAYCYRIFQKEEGVCRGCPVVRAFETGKIEKAALVYHFRNARKYIELTASPMFDKGGNVAAVAAIARDISEKSEMENKLKESKERFQAVFDGIGDGISVIDRDFNIEWINRGVLNVFKEVAHAVPAGGKCYSEYFQEDKTCDDCPAQVTFDNGAAGRLTKIWRHGRENLVLDISTFPIKDAGGRVVQVIEYFRNIAGRIKLEDQLLRYERLAGIGELAVGIAHELRNPLGNISASAQFCLNKYEIGSQVKKHLRVILRNSDNANRIVKDLLDFARPAEILLKPGYVGKVIEKACTLVKSRCSKQHVRVFKRWPKKLPLVMLDGSRMEGAFLNFIINSLDAMPAGGSLIAAAYLDTQSREVAIAFSDTGDGIAPDDLKRIFDPFFTTKKNGIGLGLSIAHHIIVCHKGNLRIKSEAGMGTEVIVRLPIAEEGRRNDDARG